jgi:hypothetical protein
MKIRSVKFNNRRKAFEVRLHNRILPFPYAKSEPRPTSANKVVEAQVDRGIDREGFTYVLESGREGMVHVDQVLEYNEDPSYMRDFLLYKMTIEAQKRVEKSLLSKREIIRRLGTSAAQFYRLLDQTNYRKSLDQILALLHVLDCKVDFVVRARSA